MKLTAILLLTLAIGLMGLSIHPIQYSIATTAYAQANNCENVKFGFGHYQKPQNSGRDIIGQSLDDIQERGWISIAVYEDFAPYSYEKNGELVGLDIDIGKLIAEDLGVKAKFIQVAAGENVDADLRNNVWKGNLIDGQVANLMMHVPYNKELICRNEQVVLGGHYYNETIAIAYDKAHYPDGGPVPAFFRFDEVGVENDSISDFYLSSIGGGQLIPKMKRYASTAEAMKGLHAGEVKAVMGPLAQLEHGLTEKLAVHSPPLVGLSIGEWTLSIATNFRWRPLGYTIEDAVTFSIQDGRMEAIFKKHGLTWNKPDW